MQGGRMFVRTPPALYMGAKRGILDEVLLK
jgi:hypothetical protein